jgi:hypothetical protein
MYCKLFAGAFIALLMTAAQASAGTVFHWPPSYSPGDCSGGSSDCNTPKTLLSKDDVKLTAKDPRNGYPANWNSAIYKIDVPACCTAGETAQLTLSIDFKGWNSDTDDFLYVSWQPLPVVPGDRILDNVLLDKYQLGDNTNTIHDTFTFNLDPNDLPETIAIAFAVEIGGCEHRSNCTKNYYEGVKYDVSLVLDCLPVSQTPLPASLPLFVSGLGALGFVGWRRKKQMAKRSGASA